MDLRGFFMQIYKPLVQIYEALCGFTGLRGWIYGRILKQIYEAECRVKGDSHVDLQNLVQIYETLCGFTKLLSVDLRRVKCVDLRDSCVDLRSIESIYGMSCEFTGGFSCRFTHLQCRFKELSVWIYRELSVDLRDYSCTN